MKLIELLARELKEWPDGATSITQDADGEVNPCNDPHGDLEFNARLWTSTDGFMIGSDILPGLELADDYDTSVVNRYEWQLAVAARLNVPTTTTPTLETMLAEWRDLEARAQAAQAEADALFEHAGQCHGEIVVRLAELGWGAPSSLTKYERALKLQASDGWIDYHGGEILASDDDEVFVRLRDGSESRGEVDTWDWSITPGVPSDGDIVAYRLIPSTQP